jgi:5'-nucleotidase
VRVLVTNDDGISSFGLAVLAAALSDAGYDVVVAAPLDDKSGSGASIGPVHMGEGIAMESVTLEQVTGVPCFSIDGPPALAVMASQLGAFGDPPKMVVSGINPGCNTGRSTLHSGTVGAALTAANFGISGLAVSVDTPKTGWTEWDELHLDTAAAYAVRAARWLVDAPPKTVLNLNVPNLPEDQILGVKQARLAPFGTVRTAIAGQSEGRLELEFQATGVELKPDTDTSLVGQGYVAVTALIGIRADAAVDPSSALT